MVEGKSFHPNPTHALKGVYLMTEPGCLKSYSGAYMHITTGIRELRKHFRMEVVADSESLKFLKNGNFVSQPTLKEGVSPSVGRIPRFKTSNRWWGVLRDLKVTWGHLKEYTHLLRQVKVAQPDFIYERAAYANFNGWLIAKRLGIPHFYEVNGVLTKDKNDQYRSFLRPLLYHLEKEAYHQATSCFCVGGVGEQVPLRHEDYVRVQNGIDKDFLEQFRHHVKPNVRSDELIHACFIGHLMKHHRLEMLIDAWQRSHYKERWHFHFVGGGEFEQFIAGAPKGFPYTYHGVVPHHQLDAILTKVQVGLIPHSQPEASYMKLYTYGAGKLLAIAPGWDNFRSAFSDEEVFFFEPEDSSRLAEALDVVAGSPDMIKHFGQSLYHKVTARYTWQKIFQTTAEHIQLHLDPRPTSVSTS